MQSNERHQYVAGGKIHDTFPSTAQQAGFYQAVLDKNGGCFTSLCQALTGLTMEKLKARIFGGPQIRQIIRNPEFEKSMSGVELEV